MIHSSTTIFKGSNIMRAFFLATALLGFCGAANAQVVQDCYGEHANRDLTDIRLIPEPWEANTRIFANGDVRLALLDMWDPANYAVRLMITYVDPMRHESEGRACVIVSDTDQYGFQNMDLTGMTAGYDPATGLIFSIETERYNASDETVDHGVLNLILNRATGQVTASFQ